ncbi:2-oxo acid dehydrogenase subunit E2 [Alicyclobacillus cycloheptanicus]|uniref:Dihydrolipoamide acetyltransferase component of pyruvate dehydrogenase complex n=1 Tax=Alicyclobacillus cycloheptanicus TaxID=1457 RepID=A0ABT9XHW8_9BACL|nr:dihydrolipoamide acetyltransferase family protein [Alicyclobacillus cycloheptanicus]MDQ0189710.1 pyruvate dehydrogenase E2 component (dihydrolipoamide acetyltransferase) [Alicyclobacillus cycloheptanicus]WDM01922.1 2-oxo acid dehydrogenase subunit E2 [Alicyclobacillus cycloheptanicus]
MPTEFRLPDVGEGIHEAEIVRWLVSEGETVREFDPIVEVQTDKAVVELPAPASGRIGEIRVLAGALAHVGDVLVTIEDDDAGHGPQAAIDRQTRSGAMAQAASTTLTAARQAAPGAGVGTARQASGAARQAPSGARRPLATPGVRYLARQLGVPLDAVQGTGRGGRIQKQDVERYASGQTGGRPAGTGIEAGPGAQRPAGAGLDAGDVRPASTSTRVPFRGIRRATAEHVSRSAFTAPHVTAFDDCEATQLVALRNRWNQLLEPEGKRVTYLPFLVKAVVSALRAFPYFNARLDEQAQEIELLPEYHIGLAVDAPDGLLVPVIRDADKLTVSEIADEISRLTRGARERTLSPQELKGSTFTITNMGPIGGMFATPIINYPEVAILAVHRIQRKPVVRGDDIVIRDVLTLSLSFDHRIIDGAASVRFMNHIRRLIENPELLMLELK